MKKLFIKDLERRFSYSPIAITPRILKGPPGKVTTLALGEEGRGFKPIPVK